MGLVGKKAPSVTAQAVVNGKIESNFVLEQQKEKYIVLFFYPLDFTFVCPTELHAFEKEKEAFEKRDTLVVGCSVDSVYSHLAWLKTPRSKGGIEGVSYPLISDLNKHIARNFDVLSEQGVAYRGLFLLDENRVVCHQTVNDLPLGRNVEEVLRMIDAMQFHKEHGEVCPANWKKGEQSLKPTYEGLENYFDSKVKIGR